MIELAIVFPILLLLFAGMAELGRLMYTYNTLAKATEVAARYLSTQRDIRSSDPAIVAAAKLKGQNLVVCGYTDCTSKTALVSGITTSNVTVTLPVTGDVVKYVKVEVSGYTYQTAVFNLANLTGKSSATFYFSLTPYTRMRFMPSI
jgi:Flp pilus assembly protein TadG